jgi:hypothetical protein
VAIDTRSKRASSAQAFLPFVLAPIDPDGDIAGSGDRQHAAHDYSGIAAPIIVVPELCIPGAALVAASVGGIALEDDGVGAAVAMTGGRGVGLVTVG